MLSRRPFRTGLKSLLVFCSSSVETAEMMDMPALSMPDIWRVKGMRSFLRIWPAPRTRTGFAMGGSP